MSSSENELKAAPSIELFEDSYFHNLRSTEYPYLDQKKQIYLDYTGGNLCPVLVLNRHHNLLAENVLGNPHSDSPASRFSTRLVEKARQAVLDFFKARDYECVFTANATAALKIIGESYPFSDRSTFVLSSDNHNSVNGIREFCLLKKGKLRYAPLHYEDLTIDEKMLEGLLENAPPSKANLFAFPAQSNVSGVKHDLSWIKRAQEKGFDVLLDAAAYVPSAALDLNVHKPEFVCLSFYKIFGYPTGIGCLLVKKSALQKLVKPWFAGGTVTLVSVVTPDRFLATGHERFEDGTPNYNNIPAVTIGLDYIRDIGMDRINERIQSLIQYLYLELARLRHDNGTPLVKIFGPANFEHRGGNMIMSFMDQDGKVIPFPVVDKLAAARNISLRTGCFCNPGIDEINNCITNIEMTRYFSSRKNGSYEDMVKFLGKMRGATRVSVGLPTNRHDLYAFIRMAESFLNRKYKD